MSSFYVVRGIAILILSAAFTWAVLRGSNTDTSIDGDESEGPKYVASINGNLLPMFLVTLLGIGIPIYGFRKAFELFLPSFFSIFLHISVYYLILMAIMPLLHKRINSRTCALLWIIPNYLYISIQPALELNRPLLTLHVSQNLMYLLLAVWLSGFLFVLMRSVIQHIIFRRTILKSATPVTDLAVLEVWQAELTDARVKKPKYRLLISEAVSTPLSFGMTNRSTRVILPLKNYTNEELALIFRHEIIHIARCDSANKFFMVFCCAMCWFNPLMWIAMRKSADDFELSCDESVLLDADENTRKQYANLILSTAGDGRGFTTCLSASAESLRYRLLAIVKSGNKRTGAIIVAVLFFILFVTCGFTAITYGDTTFGQVVQDTFGGNYTIDRYNTSLIPHNGHLECNNEEAIKDYLENLPLQKISGNYAFEDYDNYVWFFISADNKSYYVDLNDHSLKVTQLGVNSRSDTYIIDMQIDWEYLQSLFEAYHIQDSNSIFPPLMNVCSDEVYLEVSGSVRSYTIDGHAQPAKKWWNSEFDTTYFDPQVQTVRLDFSHTYTGPLIVVIDDLQGNITEIASEEMENPNILPILQQDADYTVYATFEDIHSQIEMSYTFQIRFTE